MGFLVSLFYWCIGFSGSLVSLVFWFIGLSGLPLLHLNFWFSVFNGFVSLMVSLVFWFIGLLVNWFCWISGFLVSLVFWFIGSLVFLVHWFLWFTSFSGFLVSLFFCFTGCSGLLVSLVYWFFWFTSFSGLLVSLVSCFTGFSGLLVSLVYWWMSELPTPGLPTGGQSWVHNYYVFLYIVWGLCGHWVNASVYSITLFQHMSHSLSQHNVSKAHTSLYLRGDSRLSCQCICVFV